MQLFGAARHPRMIQTKTNQADVASKPLGPIRLGRAAETSMTADRLQQNASAHGNEFVRDTENPAGRQGGPTRLLYGFAVSSVLALLVVGAVPQALAEEPSTAKSDCPECDLLNRVIEGDDKAISTLEAEVNRLKAVLRSARAAAAAGTGMEPDPSFKDTINQAQKKVDARRRVRDDDYEKLQLCKARCAMRQGRPLPPLPPAIPIGDHAIPVACPKCENAVERVRQALFLLLADERDYSVNRLAAFRELAWLNIHADKLDRAGPEHLKKYLDRLKRMDSDKSFIEKARASLDGDLYVLANCIAKSCKESSTGTPPTTSPPEREPRAECPDCEEAVLQVNADLAQVALGKALYESEEVRIARLSAGQTLTDDEKDELAELRKGLSMGSKLLADEEKKLAADRAALDACNKLHPSPSCRVPTGQSLVPGGAPAPPMTEVENETMVSDKPTIASPAGAGVAAPGGSSGTGGTAPPTATPPSGSAPPSPPKVTTPPLPAPVPPLEAEAVSAGGFVPSASTPRSAVTISVGPGLVTDKARVVGVYPANDSGILRGPPHIYTGNLNVEVSNFAPQSLPGYSVDFSAVAGTRTTSTVAPVGLQNAGWAYWTTASNGSTGLATLAGETASLKTTIYDVRLNLYLPPLAIEDKDYSHIWFNRGLGVRYDRMQYRGALSITLLPNITSLTDQKVEQYGLSGEVGVRGEHIFSNGLRGSVGVGADAIFYHADYNGTQNNTCGLCPAAEQNFDLSDSDSRNRLTLGASANAGLSYPVGKNAAISFKATYQSEFGAPTLVNKITPTDLAPHLSSGYRSWSSLELGFSTKY
jgi:hypothetical protein